MGVEKLKGPASRARANDPNPFEPMSNDDQNTSQSSLNRPFRVAVAQIAPKLGDVAANLEMHKRIISETTAAGADLVVFPELSLTGYFLRDLVSEVALKRDSSEIKQLSDVLPHTSVVFGLVEESSQNKLYNGAVWVEGGVVQAVHRKAYLPTYGMFDESRYFAAGNRMRCFDTRLGRVGILICEDAWHLSNTVILGADGADLIILMGNSPARGVNSAELASQAVWHHIARNVAMFLNVPVVFANRVGYEDGVCFFGSSQVIAPGGSTLAQAAQLEEEILWATIDPSATRQARIRTPLARDERLELTLRELERIAHERNQA
jgi:predicted amidohydrolase